MLKNCMFKKIKKRKNYMFKINGLIFNISKNKYFIAFLFYFFLLYVFAN